MEGIYQALVLATWKKWAVGGSRSNTKGEILYWLLKDCGVDVEPRVEKLQKLG